MKNLFFLFFVFLSLYSIAQTSTTPDVAINEIMASNSITQKDPAGEYDDWVELYNNTNAGIDLSNWYLTDEFTWKKKWKFPSGTIIPSNGYLIIWCDSQITQAGIHSSFKLNKGGEQVMLSKPDTSVADSITFGKQITDSTFSRIPNGYGSFILTKPTYNSANSPTGFVIKRIASPDLFLYPNPASTKFFLKGYEINKVKVFNVLMQELFFIENSNEKSPLEIDISKLEKGVYYIEINKKNSKEIKQFIVN